MRIWIMRKWSAILFAIGFQSKALEIALDVLDLEYEPRVRALIASGRGAEAGTLRTEWSDQLRFTNDRLPFNNTKTILRRAMRMHVDVPARPHQVPPGNEHWRPAATAGLGDVLTGAGMAAVRKAIRDERNARREQALGWLPILTALTGLVGTLIGLVSVWARH